MRLVVTDREIDTRPVICGEIGPVILAIPGPIICAEIGARPDLVAGGVCAPGDEFGGQQIEARP